MQDATTSESEWEMMHILMSSSAGGALMAWGESGRWVQGEISATGRPGRQGDCYLLVPGAKECPTVVGSVVGSDPSPPGRGQAAELGQGGVQQVQKLELWNPVCRMAS